MKHLATDWHVYRTRFLVRARQLTEPLLFVDCLGREHQGDIGDYLVESSDGTRRIAPREIFEDVYVAMGLADDTVWPSITARRTSPEVAPAVSAHAGLPSAARSLLRPSGSAFS
jgi:hypothetical protein